MIHGNEYYVFNNHKLFILKCFNDNNNNDSIILNLYKVGDFNFIFLLPK